MALLCKYWDHQKNRHLQRLGHEAARAKELSTKAMATSGAGGKHYYLKNAWCIFHSLVPMKPAAGKSKGADYKKLAQKQKDKVQSQRFLRPTLYELLLSRWQFLMNWYTCFVL